MEFDVNLKLKFQRCHDITERVWDLSLLLESHNLEHELRQVTSQSSQYLYVPSCNVKTIYPLFLFHKDA